jgi:hypothetical protein
LSELLPLVGEGIRAVCSVCMKHFEIFAVMDILKLFLAIHRMWKLTQECLNWAYFMYKRIMG